MFTVFSFFVIILFTIHLFILFSHINDLKSREIYNCFARCSLIKLVAFCFVDGSFCIIHMILFNNLLVFLLSFYLSKVLWNRIKWLIQNRYFYWKLYFWYLFIIISKFEHEFKIKNKQEVRFYTNISIEIFIQVIYCNNLIRKFEIFCNGDTNGSWTQWAKITIWKCIMEMKKRNTSWGVTYRLIWNGEPCNIDKVSKKI
jgi:hypothetical protein